MSLLPTGSAIAGALDVRLVLERERRLELRRLAITTSR